MKPNIEKLKQLLSDKFDNNIARFAKSLNMDRGQLSIILKTGSSDGKLFYSGLYIYCKQEGLNFEDYIFLPIMSKKINKQDEGI